MLLTVGQTTLVLLQGSQSPAQVVQLTLRTQSQCPTVSELAEWHIAQTEISAAILTIVQAEVESTHKEAIIGNTESRPQLPSIFIVDSPDFRIRCRKSPAKYLRERWELYWGDKSILFAANKWVFEFAVRNNEASILVNQATFLTRHCRRARSRTSAMFSYTAGVRFDHLARALMPSSSRRIPRHSSIPFAPNTCS